MSVRKAMTVRQLLELLVHVPSDTELNVTIAGDIHEIHSAQISIPGDGAPGIIDFQSEDLSPDTAPEPEPERRKFTAQEAANFEKIARAKLETIRDVAMELSALYEFTLFEDRHTNEGYVNVQRIISDSEGILRNERGELSI